MRDTTSAQAAHESTHAPGTAVVQQLVQAAEEGVKEVLNEARAAALVAAACGGMAVRGSACCPCCEGLNVELFVERSVLGITSGNRALKGLFTKYTLFNT